MKKKRKYKPSIKTLENIVGYFDDRLHSVLSVDDELYLRWQSIADFNSYVKAEGNDDNEIPVELLPTGFLLIDRSLLEHFATKAPKYSYLDPRTGEKQERWHVPKHSPPSTDN